MALVRLVVMLLLTGLALLAENVLNLGLKLPVGWAWIASSGALVLVMLSLQGTLKIEANSFQWWTMMLFGVGVPTVRLVVVVVVPSLLSAEPWLTVVVGILAAVVAILWLFRMLEDEQQQPASTSRPAPASGGTRGRG